MRADDVVRCLENVRKTPRGWSARCPAHADRSNSLSIAVGLNGRTLLHCFAGCQAQTIAHAVGLGVHDLFEGARPASRHLQRAHDGSSVAEARALVIAEASRQPWARPSVRLEYALADRLRLARRAVGDLRRLAEAIEDDDQRWEVLGAAARIETLGNLLEHHLDEIAALGRAG